MQLCDSFKCKIIPGIIDQKPANVPHITSWISMFAANLNADEHFVRIITHLPPQLQYFVNVYIANIKVLKKKNACLLAVL